MLASAPSTFASIANANPGCDMLNYGSPESVGMLSKTPRDMVSNLTHFTETHNLGRRLYNRTVPVGPGGITIVANRGTIEDATEDIIYDMASLAKMFTTVAVLRCLDRGHTEREAGHRKEADGNIYEYTSLPRMHSSTFFNRGNAEGPELKYYEANSRAGVPDFGREKRPRAPIAAVACAWNRPRRECLGAGRRLGPRRTLLHRLWHGVVLPDDSKQRHLWQAQDPVQGVN
ncbi:hypothetical protein H634G_00408 [Metarhizium anisopliae BRIP 53293]|uniref:Uncharacterized protein n=1 Tax=Metarhizium anisopliae BRIP 53293 TaxID=1291518 RepID=A0A0D9PGW3_METAN|nr:hypothetical protein H634G_00408 [Metarhizium anisopliae BRIP 53293]KJK88975.1 hypothetical protein H633G_07165 [Metarhizium anisopliae BRIP 53284]